MFKQHTEPSPIMVDILSSNSVDIVGYCKKIGHAHIYWTEFVR